MAIYVFVCKSCGNQFEEICSWTERDDMKCKACGASEVDKPLTTPAGHRYYGGRNSGFYNVNYDE